MEELSFDVGLEPIELISVKSYFGLAPGAAVSFYGLVVPIMLSSVSFLDWFLF